MADINLYDEVDDENPDDGYGLDDGLDGNDSFGNDDNLSALQRLEKYMESENVYTRQMVARGLLDTLRAVGDSDEQTTAVLTNMVKLSEDSDPIVRSELMEQIPHVAVYCQENRDIFQNAIPVYILPMVVRYLDDANNQVRKTSQAALLVLLEGELVDRADIEDQVIHVILELASPDSLDDYRTEAVALMSKMAPLLGKDMTERLFLSRFCEMCCDPLFHVRKVCAANFGDFCVVVSQDSTEKQLLPKFYYLCEDGVWGVRKACAECFMIVSSSCSPEVRKAELSSLFVNLLCDQSRWVRMAAFQQLGPFISTFADSDLTGIHVAEDGSLVFRPVETTTSENATGKTKIDEEGPSPAPDMCPVEGDRISDLPDLIPSTPSTQTDISENPSASPSLVCDNSPSTSEETMDTSEDQEDFLNQSEDGTSVKQSFAKKSEDNSADQQSIESNSDRNITLPNTDTLEIDETNATDQQVENNTENEIKVSSMENDFTDKMEIETSNVIAYQSNADQSVEEKRAEHYSKVDAKEESISEEVFEQQKQEDAGQGSSEQENPKDTSEIGTSTQGLVEIPLTSDNESSRIENQEGHITQPLENYKSLGQEEENIAKQNENKNHISESAESSTNNKPGHVHIHIDNTSDFDSFQFWRTPIPQLDLDLDLVDGKPQNIHVTAKVKDKEHHKVYASEMNVQVSGDTETNTNLSDSMSDLTVCDKLDNPVINVNRSESVSEEEGLKIHKASVSSVSETDDTLSTSVVGQNENTLTVIDGVVQEINLDNIDSNLLLSLLPVADLSTANFAYMDHDFPLSPLGNFADTMMVDDATLAQQQDIVPQSLLENYLGMIDPSRAQTVDSEITKYCAYNLPAVAYTLGRKNWHCIKNLYETLAADMQWKVRRTLASSIHELAVILGEEITHRDLVPVFDGFLKDLDEVRIGILRHLADFLRLLNPAVRRQYLVKVQDFMNVDNSRNWRFRLELAEQLVLISELYAAQEVSEYLLPIAMALAEDKVSEVRQESYHLTSVILRRLSESHNEKLVQHLVNQLVARFAHSRKWAGRQIYAQLCQAIIREEAVSPEEFSKDFLPNLLSLGNDPVPNVRITLAKALSYYYQTEDYSDCDTNAHKDELLSTMKDLQSDTDRDVRYFISNEPSPETTRLLDTSDSQSDTSNILQY